MSSINTDPIWVDNNEELARLCEHWSGQAAIAVDTEFMRSHTFYPHVGLLQVGDGSGCYLIDPLTIDDFSPLTALLINPAVTKVLHSCSEDLEVFRHWLGVVPSPLFDSQLAASFAGYGFSVGYAGLVKTVLGVELSKGETRSDWMQRPLSQSQLSYAALDVAYLLIVYGKILLALKEKERLQWVLDDCAELVRVAESLDGGENFYVKIKSAWKLNRQELAVLQALCLWREQQARLRDVPRNRVLKEQILWEIVKCKPENTGHFFSIEGFPSRVIHENGEELLGLISAAQAQAPESYPESLPKPLSPEQGGILKALKACTREIAEAMDLPPEAFVRKKDYEFIVRSGMGEDYGLSTSLCGWRKAVVGEKLLAVAKKHPQS